MDNRIFIVIVNGLLLVIVCYLLLFVLPDVMIDENSVSVFITPLLLFVSRCCVGVGTVAAAA